MNTQSQIIISKSLILGNCKHNHTIKLQWCIYHSEAGVRKSILLKTKSNKIIKQTNKTKKKKIKKKTLHLLW